jgi:serine/threonine-protein phosphatase 2B catalytic subunit
MDSEEDKSAPFPSLPANDDGQRNAQVDNAIRAIQDKKPPPEIDFSIHTMEDGTQVNTQERVCKGMASP